MHLHGSAPHGDNDDNSPQSASHCQQRGIVEAGGGAATGGKKKKERKPTANQRATNQQGGGAPDSPRSPLISSGNSVEIGCR